MEEERRSEGNVGLHMYVNYFRAGANSLVLLVLILLNALAHVSELFTFNVFSISFRRNRITYFIAILNEMMSVRTFHFVKCLTS